MVLVATLLAGPREPVFAQPMGRLTSLLLSPHQAPSDPSSRCFCSFGDVTFQTHFCADCWVWAFHLSTPHPFLWPQTTHFNVNSSSTTHAFIFWLCSSCSQGMETDKGRGPIHETPYGDFTFRKTSWLPLPAPPHSIETVHTRKRVENLKQALGKQANKFDHLPFLFPFVKYSIYIFQPQRKIANVIFHKRITRHAYYKTDVLRWRSAFSSAPSSLSCSLLLPLP